MKTDQLPGLSVPHTYDPVLRRLVVRGMQVFPEEVFAHADAIEVLDMSGGQLHDLPNDLGRLHRLRIAFFSNNPLGHVPKALAGCPALEMVGLKSCGISGFEDDALPKGLRGLILTDNNLTQLPSSIGELTSLQKLMLAGNALTSLPSEITQCRNLQLLRVPGNALSEVPAGLWELPKLAWYSEAANPMSYQPQLQPTKPIPWQHLEIETKIGESSKNIVYRARLKPSGQEVAVKLYGDGVTTDGHPKDEMRASIIAGTHSNLIPIIGEVVGAPDNQRGLVMELIPPDFTVPGLPPDFVTLTRDVFVKQFALPVVIEILRGVCAALEHLHQRGIMHGDVYAHNVLVNSEGQTYLGDMGAASLYQKASDDGKRERLDVHGFGYLIDDLLPSIAPADGAGLGQLVALRDGCLGRDNAITRFDMVSDALRAM